MERIYSGWLTKSPRQGKSAAIWKLFKARWRRRFFVLYAPPASTMLPGMCSAVLDYYDSDRLMFKKGTIDLMSCVELKVCPPSELFPYSFSLRAKHRGHDRIYHLASETESDMKQWIECLQTVLFLDGTLETGTDPVVRGPTSTGSVSSTVDERYVRVPEHSVSSNSSVEATSRSPPSSPPQAELPSAPCPKSLPVFSEEKPGSGRDESDEPYIHLEQCFSGPPISPLDAANAAASHFGASQRQASPPRLSKKPNMEMMGDNGLSHGSAGDSARIEYCNLDNSGEQDPVSVKCGSDIHCSHKVAVNDAPCHVCSGQPAGRGNYQCQSTDSGIVEFAGGHSRLIESSISFPFSRICSNDSVTEHAGRHGLFCNTNNNDSSIEPDYNSCYGDYDVPRFHQSWILSGNACCQSSRISSDSSTVDDRCEVFEEGDNSDNDSHNYINIGRMDLPPNWSESDRHASSGQDVCIPPIGGCLQNPSGGHEGVATKLCKTDVQLAENCCSANKKCHSESGVNASEHCVSFGTREQSVSTRNCGGVQRDQRDVLLPTKKPGLSDSSSSEDDADEDDEFTTRLSPSCTVQYLDIDHGMSSATSGIKDHSVVASASSSTGTDYKEIDWVKTKALHVTKNEVESKRRRSSDKSADF